MDDLQSLSIPNLESVGDITVYACTKIGQFSAPKVDFLNQLRVERNSLLERFDLPELTTISEGSLRIRDNQKLEDFDLDKFDTLTGTWLSIRDNSKLPSCKVDELLAKLIANGFEGDSLTTNNLYQPNCGE
jgi:hypothetical protein